jgi:hypothetical protein
MLPLVFGAHQLIESLTWWGLDGVVSAEVGDAAAIAYLAIAFLLPVAVPVAVRMAETDRSHRRWMTPFVLLGGGVSAVLLAELLSGPVVAEVCGRYIGYDVHLTSGGEITALYVIATCAPPLLSSIRRLVLFGVLNVVAVAGLAWLLAAGLISLWCAWAAVASLMIVIHLRTGSDQVARADLSGDSVPSDSATTTA